MFKKLTVYDKVTEVSKIITSDSPSQSLSGSSQENVSADVSRHNNDDNLQQVFLLQLL